MPCHPSKLGLKAALGVQRRTPWRRAGEQVAASWQEREPPRRTREARRCSAGSSAAAWCTSCSTGGPTRDPHLQRSCAPPMAKPIQNSNVCTLQFPSMDRSCCTKNPLLVQMGLVLMEGLKSVCLASCLWWQLLIMGSMRVQVSALLGGGAAGGAGVLHGGGSAGPAAAAVLPGALVPGAAVPPGGLGVPPAQPEQALELLPPRQSHPRRLPSPGRLWKEDSCHA